MGKLASGLLTFILLVSISLAETFDGAPSAPMPFRPANMDITIIGQRGSFTMTDPMNAHHGSNCESPLVDVTEPFNPISNPLVTHPISTNEQIVFICRNHVMTAIRGDSYSAVYMTENKLLDFSNEEAVFTFEMSTLRQSSRDWVDFVIMPYDTNLQIPFQSGTTPRHAIHIEMINQVGLDRFRPWVIRDFVTRSVTWNDIGYPRGFVTDPARRETFEIRLSQTRLSFCIPEYNHCWADNAPIDPPLTWNQGVVQLNHKSYNPNKDDAAGCLVIGNCMAGTWHWDNFNYNSFVPFSMIRALSDNADANSPELIFPHNAPANAHLRFAARASTVGGQQMQVSFNGGPWQDAIQQEVRNNPGDEWFKSYWMPIPVGVARVRFRRADLSQYWRVRDASIWSRNLPIEVTTQIPTSIPTLEPTVIPTLEPTLAPTPIPCFDPVIIGESYIEAIVRGAQVPCQ